jgi:hypothetical protein
MAAAAVHPTSAKCRRQRMHARTPARTQAAQGLLGLAAGAGGGFDGGVRLIVVRPVWRVACEGKATALARGSAWRARRRSATGWTRAAHHQTSDRYRRLLSPLRIPSSAVRRACYAVRTSMHSPSPRAAAVGDTT